jgi:hypothetical protein
MIWIGNNAISGYTSSNALISTNFGTGTLTGIDCYSRVFLTFRLMYGNGGGFCSLNVTYAHTGQSATNNFTGKLYYNTLTSYYKFL